MNKWNWRSSTLLCKLVFIIMCFSATSIISIGYGRHTQCLTYWDIEVTKNSRYNFPVDFLSILNDYCFEIIHILWFLFKAAVSEPIKSLSVCLARKTEYIRLLDASQTAFRHISLHIRISVKQLLLPVLSFELIEEITDLVLDIILPLPN